MHNLILKVKKQFTTTLERISVILSIFYVGWLLTQIADGFIQQNYGQVSGYIAGLMWYCFFALQMKMTKGMIRKILAVVHETNEEMKPKLSDKGGIPSPIQIRRF